jgi:protease I
VIPGGRAPEYIRNDADVQRIVRHFFGQSKPVADLCHAPLVLAAAGVLNGRKTAAYPALAPDVAQAGAEFVDSDAVVDGVVVSARAWPDHPGWNARVRAHPARPRTRHRLTAPVIAAVASFGRAFHAA